jgi:hypothetical protein
MAKKKQATRTKSPVAKRIGSRSTKVALGATLGTARVLGNTASGIWSALREASAEFMEGVEEARK